jgi:hypothetical protein
VHRTVSLAAALVALSLVATPASAHGDARGFDGTQVLAPGESFTFIVQIHYHRLVGTIDAEPASASITVSAILPNGTRMEIAPPGQAARINALVPCCLDVTWANIQFVVENRGAEPVTLVAYNAEGGASWQTLLIVIALPAIASYPAFRPVAADLGQARRRLGISVRLLSTMWAALALLSIVGMIRYGGSPLEGLRASVAPIPIFHFFVNSFLFPSLLLMAGWFVAIRYWATGWQRAGPQKLVGLRRLGYVLAAGPLVFGVLFYLDYRVAGHALALSVLPAAVLLAAMHWPTSKRTPRTSDAS